MLRKLPKLARKTAYLKGRDAHWLYPKEYNKNGLSACPSFTGSIPWILGKLLWAGIFSLCCRWKNLHADCVFAKLIFVGYLHRVNKSVCVIYSLFWWNLGKNMIEISHRYFVWVFTWLFSWCSSSFDFTLLGRLAWWLKNKESACQCRRQRRCGFEPWVRNIPWRRKWRLLQYPCLGKPPGQQSMAGYSPWGLKESDMTLWLNNNHPSAISGSCRGIFGWLPKRLYTFLPLGFILGAFMDLVLREGCHFLLCRVTVFLFRGSFPVLPASQVQWTLHSLNVGTHSLCLWQEIFVNFSLSKKKVKTINSLFQNKSSVWRERLSLNLFGVLSSWESALHKIAAQ